MGRNKVNKGEAKQGRGAEVRPEREIKRETEQWGRPRDTERDVPIEKKTERPKESMGERLREREAHTEIESVSRTERDGKKVSER